MDSSVPASLERAKSSTKTLDLLEDSKQAHKRSIEIDKQLKKERELRKSQKNVVVLLLGPSDSGKTTILKQFFLHFGKRYTDEERRAFRADIAQNVIKGMQALLAGLKFQTKELSGAATLVSQQNSSTTGELPHEICQAIKLLWSVPEVQETFANHPTTLS